MRMDRRPAGNWLAELFGTAGRGQAAQAARAARKSAGCIVGVNLGRNKSTPNEQAVFDYLALLQNFAAHADYLTINVSSPNTVGLRELQGRQALESLLTQLHSQRVMEQEKLGRNLPLLVKLAPDLSEGELDEAVDVIVRTHMDGIIVTNTSLGREGLKSVHRTQDGGLSGSPLRRLSEGILKMVLRRLAGAIPVVSAGGILCADDAKRRLDMGAALVQLYTGLVYRGPGLVQDIVKSL
jgi:dihydroorotate dehydrogenase